MGEIPKSKGPNSALYQRLNRTRNKHNEDHDTILTLADFTKNVLGVTVKVSNQTLNQAQQLVDNKNTILANQFLLIFFSPQLVKNKNTILANHFLLFFFTTVSEK